MKKNYKKLSNQIHFEVHTEEISYNYWKANKEMVITGIKFLKEVMVPYCKQQGYYVPKNLDCSEQTNTKIGMKETKNWDFGLYKTTHKGMAVFCHTRSTSVDLFILLDIKSYIRKETKLIQVTLSSKYSDDEYRIARAKAVNNVLDHIASRKIELKINDNCNTLDYRRVMIWNSVSVKRDKEKVHIKTNLQWIDDYGRLSDGWDDCLFDLSCDQFYI